MADEADDQICEKCLVLCTVLEAGGPQNHPFYLVFSIFHLVNAVKISGS